jgi:hypothetical protein
MCPTLGRFNHRTAESYSGEAQPKRCARLVRTKTHFYDNGVYQDLDVFIPSIAWLFRKTTLSFR